MPMIVKLRRFAFFAAVLLVAAGAAHPQDYPSRPIRLITPAAPGGTTDLLARLVSAKLGEIFGQQVIVDNRASASGVIAGELTAKAPPDGYTLLLAYHQHTINGALNPNLPYHPVNDFTPITQLTRAGLLLVVNPESPPRTLQEFVDWTKKRSGELNYGSAGLGSGGHLAGELYKQMANVKAQHIPYKGSGPALVDLIGGRYDYNFAGIQAAQPHVRSGKLRALGIGGYKRIAALPDVPTFAEAGVPGAEATNWWGIVAPAGTPQTVLTRLASEITAILDSAETQKRFQNEGADVLHMTPEQFGRHMAAETEKWTRVVKQAGIKAE